MSRKALEDVNYELIKDHFLSPEDSPLPEDQKELLDRIVSAAKVLDKNPVQKNAVAIHQRKYPGLCRTQAYRDLRMATRLFNTIHTFEYDFWKTWIINDIVRNIEACRNSKTAADRKTMAMEHANLIKAIGEKPEELQDPERNEKHQFYILIQNNNQQFKLDINNLHKLPVTALRELNQAIWGGNEITSSDAEELMKS